MGQSNDNQNELVNWSVGARTMAGESRSGDRYVVQPFSNGLLIGVVDGLGHGAEAADAADAAVAVLQSWAHEPVLQLFKRCHEAIRNTRGVVMSLASINAHGNTMSWLSVGNVEGVLLRAASDVSRPREFVLPRGGVVGYRLPSLQSVTLDIRHDDLLIFATDGIRSGFVQRFGLDETPRQIASYILETHAKETDDALVLVARCRRETVS